jgi:membrane-associated protease RseP (regulator of RpoE activity)
MEPIPYRPIFSSPTYGSGPTPAGHRGGRDRYWLHLLLFVLTLASTVFAGGQLVGRIFHYEAADRWISLLGLQVSTEYLLDGLRFGGSLLLFLTVHEFGHYFTARHHGIRTSLPYFIPFPLNGIGTFGAVIRIREQVPSLRKLFDIGVAGPIAGFVVSFAVLILALATLPPPDYLLDLPGHEALKTWIRERGTFPPGILRDPGVTDGMTLVVGQTPLYWALSQFFPNVPPMHEMYHYPVLFAGWIGLFFTALNLLPVGQLDGGHILYALVGPKWHGLYARIFVVLLLVSGAIGFVAELDDFGRGSAVRGLFVWFVLTSVLLAYLNRILDRNLRRAIPATVAIVLVAALAQVIGPAVTRIGYSGWLLWCFLIVFLIRIDHPPVLYQEPLTRGRRMLAWASIVVFVLCFSIKPLYFL